MVFFVEVALVEDFEEGFEAFLVADSVFPFPFGFEVVFAGFAVTLGSLVSFFTVAFFAASLVSLVAVSFLVVGFFVVEVFVTLVAAVLDLDLVGGLAGAFLVEVDLETFAGLFCLSISFIHDMVACYLPPWFRRRYSWSLEGV